MKVSAINNTNNHLTSMQSKKSSPMAIYKPYANPAGYGTAALTAGVGLYYLVKTGQPSKFAKTLAAAMSNAKGTKINAKSLSSVMSGDKLLEILPKLEKKNYIYTQQNAANGIFKVDLHSHSKYSDGNGLVKNILDDAADYANELYKKTKQKFIFALTDHDTVDGLKEALEIISSNPQRYKNLQFVPGIEVSFAHSSPKSSNPCEMSELLVYGVNPYSENVNKFINNIKQKRINMAKNFINEAAKHFPLTKFSFEEFSKYYEFEKYGNLMNIHWRAHHYVQTKQAVTLYSNITNNNPESLYTSIMRNNKGASVGSLKNNNSLPADYSENDTLTNIFKKFAPHFENNKITASSENTFEEVIDAFKDEPNIFMAFAHPAYYAQHVDNPAEGLKYFTEHSNGMIKASEAFHQAYKADVKDAQISEIQKITENLKLLNLGGRDIHNKNLF